MQACTSFTSKDSSVPGSFGFPDSGTPGTSVVDASSADAARHRDAGLVLDPLCGVGTCGESQPDDPLACAGIAFDGGHGGGGDRDGGTRDASRDGAADSGARDGGRTDGGQEAGAPPTVADASLTNSGSPGEDAASFAPARSGTSDAPPYVPIPEADSGARFSCQVHAVDNGEPVHECAPAGAQDVGEACADGSECRAGLACVAVTGGKSSTRGRCQPFCCALPCSPITDSDGGKQATFCTHRPLVQKKESTPLNVPVCVPAEGCFLEEPYPCPEGSTCVCQADQACAVVDPALGTTGCVKPGKGRLGDPCRRTSPENPCAWGYFCSATGICLKQCQPGAAVDVCAPGKCQAAAGLPDGWGLCEGPAPLTR
ncbi:MAG TPA: hypothetical protein VHE30_24000 [Polyangiaceae bacterium]|nr:hypothetical protein [Polyangiaceae bacterium]